MKLCVCWILETNNYFHKLKKYFILQLQLSQHFCGSLTPLPPQFSHHLDSNNILIGPSKSGKAPRLTMNYSHAIYQEK